MSDYAAIVSRKSFRYKIVNDGEKPYWSTNSGDGQLLLRLLERHRRDLGRSPTGSASEVARIPVGDHPQRMRMGTIRRSFLRSQD